MGSRFGGLKQAQSITPDGKALVDFSVFDARRVGFDKFVFIIRRDMEADFRRLVGDRIAKHVDVNYVFQPTDCLPQGRTKPFGTGHAVLCCKDAVKTPFVVVNADDYYGKHAFDGVYKHLLTAKNGEYAMTVYKLGQTLSTNGTVTRGICDIDGEYMRGVTECYDITAGCVGNLNGKTTTIDKDAPISMNLWALTTDVFDRLEEQFAEFKAEADLTKDEFLLPTVINKLVTGGKATVKVYRNDDKWYGITYRDDLPEVRHALSALIASGDYDGIW
jgi:dTDP-glucose pyrophosphorylase